MHERCNFPGSPHPRISNVADAIGEKFANDKFQPDRQTTSLRDARGAVSTAAHRALLSYRRVPGAAPA